MNICMYVCMYVCVMYSKNIRNYFLGGAKQPGREAGHSPPSSAEVKDEWRYTSSAPYAFVESERITLLFSLLSGI